MDLKKKVNPINGTLLNFEHTYFLQITDAHHERKANCF